MKKHIKAAAVGLSLLALNAPAYADGHSMKTAMGSVDVTLSGWARVEYGIGEDRYGADEGDDRFGISKAALETTATYGNFTLFADLGTTVLSTENNDDLSFKDIFISWSLDENSELVFGLQPFLFGLKPNGYAGDRSIIESIEYGGAGGFAVANQAGTGIRGIFGINEMLDLEVGVFDTSSGGGSGAEGTSSIDGSSLWSNYFIQLRADVEDSGIYGVVGYEGRYVTATDDPEPIVDVGIGWGDDTFDISAEWISVAKEIVGTADDETYLVFEGTMSLDDDLALIVDYATADELDVDTLRIGLHYALNDHVEARVEYSNDFDAGVDSSGAKDDVSSVDARLTFMY